MSANDFFQRWSRRKAEVESAAAPETVADPASSRTPGSAASSVPAEPPALPTMDDVEKLAPQSDYSAFVKRGVDENVKRSALKKLFTDPHFNVMDGLDIYIDDYSKPDPIPAAMLASLNHAKDLLNPLAASQRRWMTMIEPEPEAVMKVEDNAGSSVEEVSEATAQQPAGEASTPAMQVSQPDRNEQMAQIPSASEKEPDATDDPGTSDMRETNQDPR